jgi:predicted HD phosphohydrolase
MTEDRGARTITPATVAELLGLMEAKGEAAYGERITMMAHALQCVALDRADGPVLRPRHQLCPALTDR